jgi:uncharacterized MnhB-related membrane protein
MLHVLLVAGILICATQAIRAKRLLTAALWLAGVSALVALTLYVLGAREVAVIELSVGAGLVTVLFVYAIGIAGEDVIDVRTIIPKPLALGLVIVSAILLGWMTLPFVGISVSVPALSFAGELWQQRGLDVLVQIVLIFAGVLGMMGLLAEAKAPVAKRAVQPAQREPRETGEAIKAAHASTPGPERPQPKEAHA